MITNQQALVIANQLQQGNIMEHFKHAVERVPDRMAIADSTGEISFKELQIQINLTQQYFHNKGLNPGDRVLVFIPMSIELYIHVLALFQMGCTAVFVDEWANIQRLQLSCSIANCKGFIGIPVARIMGVFFKEIREIPIWISQKKLKKFRSTAKDHSFIDLKHIDATCESALITFTTGSTGIPKAANRTHQFLHQQFTALQGTIQTQDQTVDLPVLPIVLMMNLGLGVSSVIAKWNSKKPQTLDAESIANQCERHGVNRIIASPYFIQTLAKKAKGTHNYLSEHILQIFSGGAPVFPTDAKTWHTAFHGAKMGIVYGSTEAEPIAVIDGKKLIDTHVERGLCVGHISDFTKVVILPLDWGNSAFSVGLGVSEIGEIVVSGDHVLNAYFGSMAAQWTAESKIFIDGICWHKTGDAGYIDQNGLLFLVGRCNQIIAYEQQQLYPFLIENALQQGPKIKMGTILQNRNELVYCLDVENGFKEQEFVGYLQLKNLPQGIIKVLQIPRDPRHFSKIDYPKLRSLL